MCERTGTFSFRLSLTHEERKDQHTKRIRGMNECLCIFRLGLRSCCSLLSPDPPRVETSTDCWEIRLLLLKCDAIGKRSQRRLSTSDAAAPPSAPRNPISYVCPRSSVVGTVPTLNAYLLPVVVHGAAGVIREERKAELTTSTAAPPVRAPTRRLHPPPRAVERQSIVPSCC